jgi:hypothetical protein
VFTLKYLNSGLSFYWYLNISKKTLQLSYVSGSGFSIILKGILNLLK